jgi:hypothetical protein
VVGILALRAGDGGYAHGGGAGFNEHLRAGAGGGAGGVDVVYEQDVAAADGLSVGDKKSAAQILAALARSQPRLAFGGSLTHKATGRHLEDSLRMRASKMADRFCREGAGLVEAALTHAAGMQGHGDDKQVRGRTGLEELLDGGGQARSENFGDRRNAVVFKGVDGAAHCAVIDAVADGGDKGRRREATGAAERGVVRGQGREEEIFSAAGAAKCAGFGELCPAGFTDGRGCEMRKKAAAKNAGGGEKCAA